MIGVRVVTSIKTTHKCRHFILILKCLRVIRIERDLCILSFYWIKSRKYKKVFVLLFMISLNIQFHCVKFCTLMNMNTKGKGNWTDWKDREMLKIKIFLFGAMRPLQLLYSVRPLLQLPRQSTYLSGNGWRCSIITNSWAGTHWAENCIFLARRISVVYQPFSWSISLSEFLIIHTGISALDLQGWW